MSFETGVIVVYNSYSIITNNILRVVFNDNKISIHLKDLAVNIRPDHIFELYGYNNEQANKFLDVIYRTIYKYGIGFISLNGERMPEYKITQTPNGDEGLLIIDQHKIKASNIAAISFENGDRCDLLVLLCHPISAITHFRLRFSDSNKRQIFHDDLVMAIEYGYSVVYTS